LEIPIMRPLAFVALLLWAVAGAQPTVAATAIDERGFIDIRGAQHWLIIRGDDARNPVLLMIHGGPGAAPSLFGWSQFAAAGWEKSLTLVHWDQTGSGKTFAKAGGKLDPGLKLEQVVDDGIAVAEHVSRRFNGRKLVLLGNSWGTLVAIGMARKRPELFLAYVGTAQVVNKPEDEQVASGQVVAKARARNDETALAELQASGPPPYMNSQAFRAQRKWANAYENLPPLNVPVLASTTPGSSMEDLEPWLKGLMASEAHFRGTDMLGPAATTDLHVGGPDFRVPMFFIQGAEDDIAPLSQVSGFVAWIRAPSKRLVVLDGAGHNAITSRAGAFLQSMMDLLAPVVEVPAGTSAYDKIPK
jgi:pimeloyl-ACP methyl ester carboxylesterase